MIGGYFYDEKVMITIKDLALLHGKRCLFENANLLLQAGHAYGVVGANGCGKSSFLRILAGEETPSDGAIEIASRQKVGLLKQNHFAYEHDRILDVVLQGNTRLWSALTTKEELLAKSTLSIDEGMLLGELEEHIMEENGYGAEAVAHEILTGLGIAQEFHDQPLSVLSGGYKLRVLLAQVLFQAPDILLLDEPTNHLDIVSINWLEKFLKNYRGVLVIVSHDKHFLNSVCTEILDVDYETILPYVGNYDDFIRYKEERKLQREQENENKQEKVEQLQRFVDRFGASASKATQAQSKQKQIDRIKMDEIKQSSRRAPFFRFKIVSPSGKDVLTLEHCDKSFGDRKVIHNLSLKVRRGDKVAIMGPNGMGKSTLLKILVNQLSMDAGKVAWGHAVEYGYLAQDHHEQLDGNQAIMQWLRDEVSSQHETVVRATLGAMLFSGDNVHKKISQLSGGEATRVLIARIMLLQPNVIILDEPTNHLDMESIEALGKALKEYTGTVLVVSHDRDFISTIATRVVALTPVGLQDLVGSYDEFLVHYQKDYLERGTKHNWITAANKE